MNKLPSSIIDNVLDQIDGHSFLAASKSGLDLSHSQKEGCWERLCQKTCSKSNLTGSSQESWRDVYHGMDLNPDGLVVPTQESSDFEVRSQVHCSEIPYDEYLLLSNRNLPAPLSFTGVTKPKKRKHESPPVDIKRRRVNYFEVKMHKRELPLPQQCEDSSVTNRTFNMPSISVGIATKPERLKDLKTRAGWKNSTWGLHSQDGCAYAHTSTVAIKPLPITEPAPEDQPEDYDQVTPFVRNFGPGDTVGCGVVYHYPSLQSCTVQRLFERCVPYSEWVEKEKQKDANGSPTVREPPIWDPPTRAGWEALSQFRESLGISRPNMAEHLRRVPVPTISSANLTAKDQAEPSWPAKMASPTSQPTSPTIQPTSPTTLPSPKPQKGVRLSDLPKKMKSSQKLIHQQIEESIIIFARSEFEVRPSFADDLQYIHELPELEQHPYFRAYLAGFRKGLDAGRENCLLICQDDPKKFWFVCALLCIAPASRSIFYTLNGEWHGSPFPQPIESSWHTPLRAAVGAAQADWKIQVNFGADPFEFDLDAAFPPLTTQEAMNFHQSRFESLLFGSTLTLEHRPHFRKRCSQTIKPLNRDPELPGNPKENELSCPPLPGHEGHNPGDCSGSDSGLSENEDEALSEYTDDDFNLEELETRHPNVRNWSDSSPDMSDIGSPRFSGEEDDLFDDDSDDPDGRETFESDPEESDLDGFFGDEDVYPINCLPCGDVIETKKRDAYIPGVFLTFDKRRKWDVRRLKNAEADQDSEHDREMDLSVVEDDFEENILCEHSSAEYDDFMEIDSD